MPGKTFTSCQQCKKDFDLVLQRKPGRKFCSQRCRKEFLNADYKTRNIKLDLSTSKVGTLNELLVCCDLIKRKCDVYRQIGQNTCDLAIIYKNKFIRVEVKTGSLAASGRIYKNKTDLSKFDLLAIVVNEKITYQPDIFSEEL